MSAEWPGQKLVYKKTSEKPPFQTRAEIERRIARGGLTAAQKKELWHALYLQTDETEEALKVIRQNAAHPWICPMVCTAAYTGARRSELIRMRVSDVDFEGGEGGEGFLEGLGLLGAARGVGFRVEIQDEGAGAGLREG